MFPSSRRDRIWPIHDSEMAMTMKAATGCRLMTGRKVPGESDEFISSTAVESFRLGKAPQRLPPRAEGALSR